MAGYYTVEQAIEFLATKGYQLSISDLMSFVRDDRLNPSFYYKGLLHEFSYARPPSYTNHHGYALTGDSHLEFEGYVKPFDDSIIPKLVSTDKSAHIRSLKIFNKISIKHIEVSLENYDSSFFEDPFEKISKSILENIDFNVYEITHHCNYDLNSSGLIELNTIDFIFKEQELNALLPHTLLHPEQLDAAIRKHLRESSQVKARKRHALNHEKKAKAIELWKKDPHRYKTAFANKYHREIGAGHESITNWIREYEKHEAKKEESGKV